MSPEEHAMHYRARAAQFETIGLFRLGFAALAIAEDYERAAFPRPPVLLDVWDASWLGMCELRRAAA